VVDVLVFQFGTLININEINRVISYPIQKDRITFNLCGYTNIETIKDNLIRTNIEKSSQAKNMAFVGFKLLNKVEDLILPKYKHTN